MNIFKNDVDIGKVVDNSLEIHQHKNNKNIVILILKFIRDPDIKIKMCFLEDLENTSELSKIYIKPIKKDIKTNKQYFLIDNIKYYLKHNII